MMQYLVETRQFMGWDDGHTESLLTISFTPKLPRSTDKSELFVNITNVYLKNVSKNLLISLDD